MPRHPRPQKRFLSKDGPTPAEQRWRPVVEEWRRTGQDIGKRPKVTKPDKVPQNP
jgi:hypothetical protein